MTAAIEATQPANSPRRLSTMLRSQVAAIRARRELGRERARQVWEQLGERLRAALSLPTKQQMGELNERLARLEQSLDRLSGAKAAPKTVAEKRVSSAKKSVPKAKPF